MHLLFIFLDGVGLGESDPEINPFARAYTPNLDSLIGNKRLVLESLKNGIIHTERASLTALDACLGIEGLPQSATGQAVLMTGRNIPAEIGYHYGPKPNPEIAAFLKNGNLFNTLTKLELKSALLNAYPSAYFSAIKSRRRIYSSIPLAVTSAGIDLKTTADLKAGHAIAADFTGEGWHSHLKISDTPIINFQQAGQKLAELGKKYDFSMFEYWLSDFAGHKQRMTEACEIIENFDQVLGGLITTWEDKDGLILITSDHGNLEDLRVRRHTLNHVPGLLIGSKNHRLNFFQSTQDLTCITPSIISFLRPHSITP